MHVFSLNVFKLEVYDFFNLNKSLDIAYNDNEKYKREKDIRSSPHQPFPILLPWK